MPEWILGVDGGSTKTIALVADDQGRIVGAGRAGNSNWIGPDVETPMQVVIDAVMQALDQAGLTGDDIALGVFGLAGADWPEDHERRQVYLERAGIARRALVKNDAFVGLRAGTRRPYGVVIAAGTGCNAAAIAPDGREWHFGYYEDYGGAITIGREAVRAVLHAEDGRGEPTAITGVVLDALGYADPEALLRAKVAGKLEKLHLTGLCPLVFETAHAKDDVASAIIANQGRVLGEYAIALIRRFAMQDDEFDVVLSGSVFKGKGELLIDTITSMIHLAAPRARVIRPRFEPAVGGLLLAYDALSSNVTDEIYDNLAQTAPDAGFFCTAG